MSNDTLLGTPVTGCVGRFPMVDRHGRQLRVGDRLRAQVCTGRYGQVQVFEVEVTQAHEPYGFLSAPKGCIVFHLHGEPGSHVLKAEHTHHDFEHGHDTWAEVIA